MNSTGQSQAAAPSPQSQAINGLLANHGLRRQVDEASQPRFNVSVYVQPQDVEEEMMVPRSRRRAPRLPREDVIPYYEYPPPPPPPPPPHSFHFPFGYYGQYRY